ncbi:MAG: hypothetical protein EBW31_04485, partial [Actinobacteria bacterium]|nr:hypothetical protein [Actinomycetota bacterium]
MRVMMLSEQDARKLRPSVIAGLIFVLGIVLVYVVQLSLNMVLTQDAYKLSQLMAEKRQLATEVQIIQEEVDSLASPQNLADAANRLGMVANPASVLLDIRSGKVFGDPVPADPDETAVASANMVANAALGTVSEFSPSTIAASGTYSGIPDQVGNMGTHAKLTSRLTAFVLLLFVLVGALGWRLVDFQVVRAEEIQEKSLERRSVTQTLTALRGDILDSSGQVLARTVFRYDVNAAPKNVGPVFRAEDGVVTEHSVEAIAMELAPLLGLSLEELLPRLEGDSEYANLAKAVDAATYNAIRDLRVPWIYFDQFSDRLYPNGAVAGNLIGFVGSDGTPLAGLERQFNSCLAGVDGQEKYERSAEGVRIPTSNVVTQPTQDGGNLNLTIDSNLQFFAQQVLADTVAELNADWASAIVIEVETGRILAAAEAPTVDPNDPAATDAGNRGSKIMQFAFEPGSIMKAISSAMVLDSGAANEFEIKKAPDRLQLDYGESIKDSFDHDEFDLSLAGVLRYSS